jgi:hypothetical protein
MTRAAFEASRRPEGADFVGSPAEVAEKSLSCESHNASMLMGRKPAYMSSFRPINLACVRKGDERAAPVDFPAKLTSGDATRKGGAERS